MINPTLSILKKDYPYRAIGGQNKIVYSTRFVTRRAIISLLPGLCDKEGNNIIIARQ